MNSLERSRPDRWSSGGGGEFYVNAQSAADGYVKVSVLEEDGSLIEGLRIADCLGVEGDTTRGRITWKGANTLASLKDRYVRLVFHLQNAKLYSFWIE